MKRGLMTTTLALGILGAGWLASAQAAPERPDLEGALEQRILGEPSRSCVLAARIGDDPATGRQCADPDAERRDRLDEHARFEIGSVSKAMQGIVLARLVERGELDLEDRLVDHLPDAVRVPGSEEDPIRLRHLLTHTSGLPRLPEGISPEDPANPYADLSAEDLLDFLEQAEPEKVPGEAFEYSNFGTMLLSLVLSRHAESDFGALLERELLEPLGMEDTGLGGNVIQGHDSLGREHTDWDFDPRLAGVGGVRSTLADLSRLTEAMLEPPEGELGAALERSAEVLAEVDGNRFGWGWLHVDTENRELIYHGGATYGAIAEVVLDPEAGDASIVLADTFLAQGNLQDLALHLLDASVALHEPDDEADQEREFEGDLSVLAGDYALYDGEEPFMDGMVLEIFAEEGSLMVRAHVGEQVQDAVAMDYVGSDRFVMPAAGIEMEFVRGPDGEVEKLDFEQGPYELTGHPE